ncbi:hypothetical protein DQM68_00255 [Leptospira mayottensis]|uniref:Uncharacterized protein n=2 Tax=Leptospira mayottensis TaxID=1137606 RepID=A0AA87MSM6_9LEPT|nr:hypothetical protein DQM68_00255 [Leptospira mayottensis]AXR63168.1 hypothetical protein DQM28_01890 [Leptospira mayottensis]AZQ01300.1 hypothetical protein LEP1GSC190_03740 [Leptospira mayottensis 200901116]EKS01185.1 hypothetical protein LEP1GSC125_1241 [Leptospira mayottensis 200901122]TGN14182.1 hypothetical protein EHR03_04265 [Leptospira mayottensis]
MHKEVKIQLKAALYVLVKNIYGFTFYRRIDYPKLIKSFYDFPLELVPKPEKRNRLQKLVIKRNVGVPTDHSSLIIYGLSNRFYCSCTLVGVLTIPSFGTSF